MRVYTIGHGDRTPEELADLLCKHGVTHVVDIRHESDAAASGVFEPSSIRVVLLNRGIMYANMSNSLGIKRIAELSDPAQHEADEDLRVGLTQLVQVVMSDPDRVVCLVGKEKSARNCHRCTIVGDALAGFRVQVEHIEDEDAVPHHVLIGHEAEETLF